MAHFANCILFVTPIECWLFRSEQMMFFELARLEYALSNKYQSRLGDK
jgi:hypothetical protein